MQEYLTQSGKKATVTDLSPDSLGNIVVLHEDGRYRLHDSRGQAFTEANIEYDLRQYNRDDLKALAMELING